MIEKVDVLIVGTGPAGTSTALHLLHQRPNWAQRVVMVDKATHPREKLCGGGITHMGQNILIRLGLPIAVPTFDVKEARLVYQDQSYSFLADPAFRVVRRAEFDHWLVQEVSQRGVAVRQGEGVTAVTPHADHVAVSTDKATYHAKIVVAADGSRSFVRRALKWEDTSRVARLIEVLTPEQPQHQPEFQNQTAVFDFTPMSEHGLQGYYWDFPSFVDGQPFMNRGVFDSRARPERPKANLKETLRDALRQRERDLEAYELKGHPIRWWDANGRFAMPHVLLVGDAAGADPLMGEGISFALGYGEIAALAIHDAFERQDFSLTSYNQLLRRAPLFRQLNTRTKLARFAYLARHPAVIRAGWQVARMVIRFTRWSNPHYIPIDKTV